MRKHRKVRRTDFGSSSDERSRALDRGDPRASTGAPFRVAATRITTLVALLLAGASCRAHADVDALPDGGTVRTSRAASAAPVDGLGTVYPRDAPLHPLATRLCDALHALPARRKTECCGGATATFLATECARIVGATLHAGTAELDEAAVDRCASAMNESVAGCGWVTPNLPPAPDACRHLVRGTLERGAVCRSSLECAGAMHCEGVSPTKTGVCTPPAQEGAGCGTHVDVLATYLLDRDLEKTHPFCADHCALASHRCGAAPPTGAACTADINCDGAQLCLAGRCTTAARGHSGDSCGAVPCGEGLRCIDAVCIPLAKLGEACVVDQDCAVGGCVGERGHRTCGAQCTASLDALHHRDNGRAMLLPTKSSAD